MIIVCRWEKNQWFRVYWTVNYVDNEPEFESCIDYIPNHNLTKLSSLPMHMTLMIVSDDYIFKYIIWSNKF